MGKGDRVSGGRGLALAGVRVDGPSGVRLQKVQRVQRFDTAYGREGCGGRLWRQYDKTFTTTLLA